MPAITTTNFFVYNSTVGTASDRIILRWGNCPTSDTGAQELDANEVLVTHATFFPVLLIDQEIRYNQTTAVFTVANVVKTTGQLAAEGFRQRARLLREADAVMTTDIRDLTSFRRYSEWAAYRKALRDLPEGATWPATIPWPSVPASVHPLPPAAPFFRISAADPKTWGVLTTARTGAVATRWNRQGLMETVAANKTRVDFDPVTGVVIGFMSEAAATNVCIQSQSIGTTPWAQTRASATLAARAGPFGTNTMTKLMSDATAASTHQTFQAFTAATAGVLCWVKLHVAAGEYPGIQVQLSNAGMTTFVASFNAATGVQQPVNQFQATLKSNGIWEINTYCIPQSAGAVNLTIRIHDGTSATFNGDAAKGVFVDCCQVEFGGVFTSYIPTTTAAVTRNADDHDLIFTSDDFNPAMFSVYCEAKYNAGASLGVAGTRYAFAIDNTTVNNVVGFSNTGGAAHGLTIIKAGVTEVSISGARGGVFDPLPAAARVVAGDIAISNDGVSVQTSANMNVPQFALIAPRLRLGRNAAGNHLGGHIRELAIYSGEALSNAELIALAA